MTVKIFVVFIRLVFQGEVFLWRNQKIVYAESYLKFLPAFIVLIVENLARFLAPFCDRQHQRCFEHECELSAADKLRLNKRYKLERPYRPAYLRRRWRGFREALSVRTVRCADRMQRSATWVEITKRYDQYCITRKKTVFFCFVFSANQTHKFTWIIFKSNINLSTHLMTFRW